MVTSASLPNKIVGARDQTSAEDRPLKVMHVITDLDVGGAERMLVSYLTAPRKVPLDCFVVSLLSGGYFATWLRKSGLRVDEMKMGRAIENMPRSSYRSDNKTREARYHTKLDVSRGPRVDACPVIIGADSQNAAVLGCSLLRYGYEPISNNAEVCDLGLFVAVLDSGWHNRKFPCWDERA